MISLHWEKSLPLLSESNCYLRPTKKIVRSYSVGFPRSKGVQWVYPREHYMKSWKDFPADFPKTLFIDWASDFFRSFPLPELPQFVYIKQDLFCFSSRRWRIASLCNFVYFLGLQEEQARLNSFHEIASFFFQLNSPLKMTVASSAYNAYLLHSNVGRKSRTCSNLHVSKSIDRKGLFTPFSLHFSGLHKNLFKYDVNSAYPAQMAKSGLPLAFCSYGHNDLECLRRNIKQKKYIWTAAEVFVKDPPIAFPAHKDGSILLCGDVLEHEVKRGNIEKVLQKFLFSRGPACSVIPAWYRKRFYSDGIAKQLWKVALNSIFGQFAKRTHPTQVIQRSDSQFDEVVTYLRPGESYRTVNLLDFSVISRCEGSFHSYSAPWFSMAVVQNHLQSFVPSIPAGAVYADTDSFFTLDHNAPVKVSDRLGDWKKEAVPELRVYGLKNYSMGEHHVLAGVKRGDKIEITPQGLDISGIRKYNGQEEIFEQKRFL